MWNNLKEETKAQLVNAQLLKSKKTTFSNIIHLLFMKLIKYIVNSTISPVLVVKNYTKQYTLRQHSWSTESYVELERCLSVFHNLKLVIGVRIIGQN